MFAARLICSSIGAFGLAAGAFCQTYVQFSVGGEDTFAYSINDSGVVAGHSAFGLGPFRVEVHVHGRKQRILLASLRPALRTTK